MNKHLTYSFIHLYTIIYQFPLTPILLYLPIYQFFSLSFLSSSLYFPFPSLPPTHASYSLFSHLFICFSFLLSLSLSFQTFNFLFIQLFICLSILPSFPLSIYSVTRTVIHRYIHLTIHYVKLSIRSHVPPSVSLSLPFFSPSLPPPFNHSPPILSLAASRTPSRTYHPWARQTRRPTPPRPDAEQQSRQASAVR